MPRALALDPDSAAAHCNCSTVYLSRRVSRSGRCSPRYGGSSCQLGPGIARARRLCRQLGRISLDVAAPGASTSVPLRRNQAGLDGRALRGAAAPVNARVDCRQESSDLHHFAEPLFARRAGRSPNRTSL